MAPACGPRLRSGTVPLRIYLARSHGWLRDMLLANAHLDEGTTLAESRRDADVVVYLSPPWPDSGALDRLARFGRRDFQRMFVFSQSDFPVPWAPGMYASLPASRSREGLVGGFYVAPNHQGADMLTDRLEAARNLDPDLLWSFVGTVSNAPVRQHLARVDDPQAVVRDTQQFSDEIRWNRDPTNLDRLVAHRSYAELLGRSLFVACPRGRGPGSMRLFETMQVGRCPVILADDWLPPPFVDWEACSVRIPERQVTSLPEILRTRRDEATQLGLAARRAWEANFSPTRQLATIARAAVTATSSIGTWDRAALFTSAVLDKESARLAYRGARKRVRTALQR